MGNRQSTTRYEKLIEHPIPENIKCDIRVPIKFDLVTYFEFSLNQIEYNFKVFIKSKECFEYRYRSWTDCRKAFYEQRRLQLTPILKIKHLSDKDYSFEIYNTGELILETIVNLDVGCKSATYIGL
jgi:hypothetical protein